MISSISSCTAAQNASNLQQTAVNSPDADTTRSATDTVSISGEARTVSLLNGLWESMGVTPNSDGSISIESIRGGFENGTAYIEEKLNALYGELGIDAGSEMEIDVQDGHAKVSGESPVAEELEAAINSDPELLNTMRQASANASLLAASEEAASFRTAYENNPEAAVGRYGYLFADNRGFDVVFTMKNGALDVGVDTGYSFASSKT